MKPAQNRGRRKSVKDSEVKDLYLSGMTQQEIADQLGVSVTTVHHSLKRSAIKSRPPASYKTSFLTEGDYSDMAAMYNEGYSVGSIADQYSVSYPVAHRIISERCSMIRGRPRGIRQNPAPSPDKYLERYYDHMRRLGAKPNVTQQILKIIKRHDIELSDLTRLLSKARDGEFEMAIHALSYVFPLIMSEDEDYEAYTKIIKKTKDPKKRIAILLGGSWLIALAAEGNKYANRFLVSKEEEADPDKFNE